MSIRVMGPLPAGWPGGTERQIRDLEKQVADLQEECEELRIRIRRVHTGRDRLHRDPGAAKLPCE
jgi:hypothetical protein